MRKSKENENIGNFLRAIAEYGVKAQDQFQVKWTKNRIVKILLKTVKKHTLPCCWIQNMVTTRLQCFLKS